MNPNPNPSAVQPPPLVHIAPPLPPAAQPPRSSFSCDRHPAEHFSGFCPSCLCERLAGLDQSSSLHKSAAAGTLSSTATAALKAIFRPSSSAAPAPTAGGGACGGAGGGGGGGCGSKRNSTSSKPSSSFFAELRRTKSFSASKGEGFSGVFEPQRKSCDVRVRNTLWSLFNRDDERKSSKVETRASTAAAAGDADVDIDNTILPSSTSVREPVFEEVGDDIDTQNQGLEEVEEVGDDEIRVFEEGAPNVAQNNNDDDGEEIVAEIVEVDGDSGRVKEEEEDLKPMKEHIDLDSQIKKPAGRDLKEIAGSFWSAASVFSKKLQKWRRKQKLKKRGDGSASASLPALEKPLRGRQYRETQSEAADYVFGRRSCDTDPRFSLDAGRMSLDAGRISFDDPRYSFDEPPRVSWDGYLIGRTLPPRLPPMVSVVEDAPPPVPAPVPVPARAVSSSRTDNQIAVEAPSMDLGCINEDEIIPGGSAQTREYYSDPSSRRKKSLDRSSSIRKTAAAVVAEIEELKSASNAKVSPATADYLSGSKVLPAADRELMDSNSSLRGDDCSESFELPGFRDSASTASVASVCGNGDQKEAPGAAAAKKPRRWKVWNIWGLIYRRSGGKDEDEDRFSRLNGVERSLSESWHDFRSQGSGDVKGSGFNRGVFRSNSSVSSRNLYNLGSDGGGGGRSFGGSVRKSGVEANGHACKKKKDEFVLERNRSARYSPGHFDSGLLRFYLTPLRGSRRSGSGKNRLSTSHSIASSVLRLY